jgi:hypothetical protein
MQFSNPKRKKIKTERNANNVLQLANLMWNRKNGNELTASGDTVTLERDLGNSEMTSFVQNSLS